MWGVKKLVIGKYYESNRIKEKFRGKSTFEAVAIFIENIDWNDKELGLINMITSFSEVTDTLNWYVHIISLKTQEEFPTVMQLINIYADSLVRTKIFNNWSTIDDTDNDEFIAWIDQVIDVVNKYPDILVKKVKELEFLYRAQRGNHFGNYERMVPTKAHSNSNRWSFDGEDCLYLGYDKELNKYDDTINYIEKTCCEEVRLKNGEEITICSFNPSNKGNKKLINLCYDDLKYEEIKKNIFELSAEQIESYTLKALKSKKFKNKQKVLTHSQFENLFKGEIALLNLQVEKNLAIYTLKNVENAIFKPITDAIDIENYLETDEEKKERLKPYIPFRYFAKYLKDKGFDGIIYRSTRMYKLRDSYGERLKGKNVILFNKNDAQYDENVPMKVYRYEGGKYVLISPPTT